VNLVVENAVDAQLGVVLRDAHLLGHIERTSFSECT